MLSEDVLEIVQNDSDGMIALAHMHINLFDELGVECLLGYLRWTLLIGISIELLIFALHFSLFLFVRGQHLTDFLLKQSC